MQYKEVEGKAALGPRTDKQGLIRKTSCCLANCDHIHATRSNILSRMTISLVVQNMHSN